MRCVNCGNELEPGSRFCVNCGTPVGQGQQTSAPGTAPGQGVSPGSMGGMNAPQKAVVRQKSKKMSPAIIVVIIVVIVGVMAAAGYGIGRFVLSDDPGSDTKTSESKESTKDEEKSEKEDSSSGEDADQEEFTLEGVDKDNVADYDNILSKSKYKSFNDGDFSFIYPIGFFNNVEKTTDGETVKYDFTSTDENTELVYEKTPEQGISENTIISLSEGKNTELYDVDFYPYKIGKPYLGTNEKLKGKKFQGYSLF